ncbi:MAG TPA: hypothetical protein VK438_09525 [Xanthobacteraceae bacterium]|nr:hypothetical protein [Xanthobacteraceae bacterium]
MMTRAFAICAGLLVTAVYLGSTPVSALTMKECSEKYKAAKAAGDTTKWNDFRKAQCGSDATAAPAAAPAAPPAAGPAAEEKPAPKAKKAAKAEPPAAAPAAPSDAVFPSAVSDKYKSESAGKARLHTCLDQYKANKDNNGNGGLKWIQKGGGYYSECNKRLKGAA